MRIYQNLALFNHERIFSRLNLKSFESVQQKVLLNKRCQKKLINKVVEKIEVFRKYFRQKLV